MRKPTLTEDQAFLERLEFSMSGQSLRAAADRLGISHSALRSYLIGKSEPVRSVLLEIANISGVGIEWLMTGLGSSSAKAEPAVLAEDKALLAGLLRGFLAVPKEKGMPDDPQRIANWVIEKYSSIINLTSDPAARLVAADMAIEELNKRGR